MNILQVLTRHKKNSFHPQQNVRYDAMARVEFGSRRDKKRFHRAGLGHIGATLSAAHEAKKHQPFEVFVNGQQMIGRIIKRRYHRAVIGDKVLVMLVECQTKKGPNPTVVHVSIPFEQALIPA